MKIEDVKHIKHIHHKAGGLPRNFAVFTGGDFETALRDMTQALADPAINLAVWNPSRYSVLDYRRAEFYAAAAMEKNEQKDGIWASDTEFVITDLPAEFWGKTGRSLAVCPTLTEHFNNMAAAGENRVEPRWLQAWQETTGGLLDAVNRLFAPNSLELSTRAHKELWYSRFHVDDGTSDKYIRLLHHLSGRGTFYADAADIVKISRIPHKPHERAEIEFREGADTIWESLPGSLAMIGGKATESCIVHSVPFVPQDRERKPRCIEVIDFTAARSVFDMVGACRPG